MTTINKISTVVLVSILSFCATVVGTWESSSPMTRNAVIFFVLAIIGAILWSLMCGGTALEDEDAQKEYRILAPPMVGSQGECPTVQIDKYLSIPYNYDWLEPEEARKWKKDIEYMDEEHQKLPWLIHGSKEKSND